MDPIQSVILIACVPSIHARQQDHWQGLADRSSLGGATGDFDVHVGVFETDDGFEFEPG